jgi:hypothetical protein
MLATVMLVFLLPNFEKSEKMGESWARRIWILVDSKFDTLFEITGKRSQRRHDG